VKNPWKHFLEQDSKDRFHDSDRSSAKAFNLAMVGRPKFQLAEHLEPFPYLGNPDAEVFVLLANPGKSGSEVKKTYKITPKKLRLSNQNLVHDGDDFSLRLHSPNNPELESPWVKSRTKRLVEEVGVDLVANRLFLVNFHAYHSTSWYPIPFTFETQKYSFHLVEKAIRRGAMILMSRNTIGWSTAVPELTTYRWVYHFQSSRSVHISPKNLPRKVFSRLVQRLSS